MKKTLTVLFLTCFSLPLLFQCFVSMPTLVGMREPFPKPHLSIQSVVDGIYQDSITEYEEEYNGLRYPLSKVYNEINYRLFHKGSGDIIICKDDYLIKEQYINAYLGIGADSTAITAGFARLDSLHALLKRHGRELIFIVAPGKASFNAEKIPDHYFKDKQPYNNYDIICHSLYSHSFPAIDFHAYFDSLKPIVDYEILPKKGIHWTQCAASFALDSVKRYAEHLMGVSLPQVTSMRYERTTVPRITDADLLENLNLLFPKETDTLTYRYVSFKGDTTRVSRKPRVLLVGDSYAGTLAQVGLVTRYFDKYSNFIYYMRKFCEVPPNYHPTLPLSAINLEQEIQKYDLIIFVSTEINYHEMDWGLYDRIKNMQWAAHDSLHTIN